MKTKTLKGWVPGSEDEGDTMDLICDEVVGTYLFATEQEAAKEETGDQTAQGCIITVIVEHAK